MIKVLFVCHGNICRSPMAEFIFKDMVARRGIAEQFHISSAATSQEEIGQPGVSAGGPGAGPSRHLRCRKARGTAAGRRLWQVRPAAGHGAVQSDEHDEDPQGGPGGQSPAAAGLYRSARRHRRSLVLWPVRPDLCGHLPWLRRTVDHTGILTPLTNAPPNRAGRFLRHCPFCLFFSRFLIQVSCISTFLLI